MGPKRLRTLLLGLLAASAPAVAQSTPDESAPTTPTDDAQPATEAAFRAPSLTKAPEPVYPPGVVAEAQQVVMQLLVDERGRVESHTVVSGEPAFVLAVEAVLEGMRFEPATEGSTPVAVELPFTFSFPEPPINVTGSVLSAGDRKPVPHLTLRVGDRRVVTDDEGVFEVQNLAPGDYEVLADGPGYTLTSTSFTLAPDEAVDLVIYSRTNVASNEVVGVYTVNRSTTTRRVLDRATIRMLPGSMGDPVRAIQNEPGMVRSPLDAGWLIVRGGDPDDTAIHVSGVRVPLLYHLGGFTSIVHPEMVKGIEFWPGAYPAKLGNSISGAVDIIPRDVGDDVRIAGGVNVIYANAFIETPIPKVGGLAVAVRRSYLDAILTAVLDADRAKIAPRFWDWQARFSSKYYSMMFLGLSDVAQVPSANSSSAVDVTQGAIQLQGTLDVPLSETVDLTFQHWYGQQNREYAAPSQIETVKDYYPGLRLSTTWRPAGTWKLVGGVEAEYRSYHFARDLESRVSSSARTDPWVSATVGKALRGTLGVRLDTLWAEGQDPRARLSPRGDLRWQITDQFALVTEAGIFHQSPPFTFVIGYPEGRYLRLEESSMVSAGMRFDTPRVRVEADGFYRNMDNIAGLEADGSLGQLHGRAWGVEFNTSLKLGDFSGRLVYQYIRTERREESGQAWKPGQFDVPHNINLIAAYRLPKGWMVSSRWRFTSGYPLDEPVDVYDILTQEQIEVYPKNGRVPPFHSLDLKVAKTFEWKKWHLDVYVDVQNVYNRRVPEPTISGINEKEPVYAFGLPILPVFGIDAIIWP